MFLSYRNNKRNWFHFPAKFLDSPRVEVLFSVTWHASRCQNPLCTDVLLYFFSKEESCAEQFDLCTHHGDTKAHPALENKTSLTKLSQLTASLHLVGKMVNQLLICSSLITHEYASKTKDARHPTSQHTHPMDVFVEQPVVLAKSLRPHPPPRIFPGRRPREMEVETHIHLCKPYKNDVSQNSGMFRFFFENSSFISCCLMLGSISFEVKPQSF